MNLGPAEIAILLVLVVLLFGAKKLPELGSSVGKTITNFKRGMADAKDEEADTTGPTGTASDDVTPADKA
jgi:sec-independent protein translocase protein TatA